MNQSEIEQWITQNGGPQRVQYSRASTQVDNPAADPVKAKQAGVKFDPAAPDKISVATEKWVAVDEKGQPTGAALHVKRNADGDFDIIDQANPNPTKPNTATRTPTEQAADAKAAQDQKEREKNAAWPQDQDPAYETDAERRKRGDERIAQQRQQGIDTENARKAAQQGTIVERPDGSYIIKPDGTATKVQGVPPPDAPKGTLVQRSDGTYMVSADGKTATKVTGLPPEPKPGQIVRGGGPNGEDVQAVADPTTGEISYRPITGAKAPNTGAGLKNVDPYQPDFNAPDLGIGAWATKQRQKIGLPAEQGGITQADYDSATKQAHDDATVTITNLTSKQGVERQRHIDEQNQRQKLGDDAAGDFNSALGVFNQVWKYADPKTGSIRNLIPGLMAEQAKYRKERQGDFQPMPALHPMFQSVAANSAATAQPPAAKEASPATGPEPAPYQPPATPNALGLGAIGDQPAPGGQPAPSPAPGGQPVQPAFMPPPPISGAPVSPQSVAAPPVSAPAMAAPPPPVPSAPTIPTPSALPPADEFGQTPASGGATTTPPGLLPPDVPYAPHNTDPSQGPVGQTAGPLTAFAQNALAPASDRAMTPDGGAPMNPAIANTVQQAGGRPAQFDPFSTAGRLAQMGVDPDIIAQVMTQNGYVHQGMMPQRGTM